MSEAVSAEGNLTAALGAIANTKSEHEWTIVLDGIADAERYWVSRELQESISQAIDRGATRRCCYNPIDGTIAVVKKKNFSETWRKAMEACVAEDNWIDVYKHDLEVPGFDFVAPAMVAQHYWDLRGYRFKFEADDVDAIAELIAGYVLSKEKVHEKAKEVQFKVRGAEITPKKLQEAMERAIGTEKYQSHYACFFSFDPIVLKKDEIQPNVAYITLRSRQLALGKLAQHNETIKIDAFDAKDKSFCSYGFYEIKRAEGRKLAHLALPKGNELTDEEWRKLADSIMFSFFSKEFLRMTLASDVAGIANLMKYCEDDTYTLKLTDDKQGAKIITHEEVHEKQKNEFLKSIGNSNETTTVENYTWLDNDKLAEILLKMSKPTSQGHLEVKSDTDKGLTDAIRKLLEDTSVTNKRNGWILKCDQKIDLASLIPYMKTYFAMPYKGEDEILFVKDEEKCRKYAFKLLKGHFENPEKIVEVQPYWQRFCMKEVLEAVSAPDSKVKVLKVNVDENSADALRKTLIDFCKTVPVQRKPFILRLVAPEVSGEKVLKKIIEGFQYDFQQSLSNKSIILADSVEELNDEGRRVYVLSHYEVSLNFMRLEDFVVAYSLNRTSWDGSKEVGEGYKDLPTETLFNCLNDPKCKAVHFEILRDVTKGEVIDGITSMLANQKGRTGFTVHFASKKIADEETVKAIADAVSKLNENENNRFVVPMYKDNLFLFVDKGGWTCKKQMENSDTFVCKENFGSFDLQMTKLRELLYLMSLPTSKAKTLALNEVWLSEHSLELILDHGNRTGWSLTGGWMNNAVTGKSMYCLSTYNPRPERFLDKETFQKELKELFLEEKARYLIEYRAYPLSSIFEYQISHWDRSFLGTMPLSEALKYAEQAKGEYRTLELEASVSSMSKRDAAEFIKWIKAGLKDICKEELSKTRICYLSLKGLSKEQRKEIMDLELDKDAKRELAFSDGDEDALNIGTRKPFAKRLTKPGNG